MDSHSIWENWVQWGVWQDCAVHEQGIVRYFYVCLPHWNLRSLRVLCVLRTNPFPTFWSLHPSEMSQDLRGPCKPRKGIWAFVQRQWASLGNFKQGNYYICILERFAWLPYRERIGVGQEFTGENSLSICMIWDHCNKLSLVSWMIPPNKNWIDPHHLKILHSFPLCMKLKVTSTAFKALYNVDLFHPPIDFSSPTTSLHLPWFKAVRTSPQICHVYMPLGVYESYLPSYKFAPIPTEVLISFSQAAQSSSLRARWWFTQPCSLSYAPPHWLA